jgi:outer membrane protein OmpA-like peptidoglycan-associated protein
MTKSGSLLRLTMVLGLTLSAGACSTLADLDPTGLLGGSDNAAPDSQFPDAGAPPPSDAAAGTTPDLASLPARPVTTTPAQQQQAAQSLAADGAQVQYGADALRGGAEAAAPPPGAAGPMIAVAPAPAAPAGNADNDAPPTTEPAPPVPSQAAQTAPQPAAAPTGPAAVPAGNQVALAAPPTAQTPAAPAAPASSPAATPPASGGEPAVPANTPVRGAAMLAAGGVSDAELGFKPSTAQPLNPAINQWVAAPIIARYRQTASNAGISTPTGNAAVPAGPAAADSVAANGGMAPTAVIYFAGDGTVLSASARAQIRNAVAAFKAGGGAGTVRVVGHASSRTADMSVEKHLETIFDKSQKRANAVAQELIHQGVPASKVLVEAVGDSQPVYYESMPKGEAGNRRAEIFVQT